MTLRRLALAGAAFAATLSWAAPPAAAETRAEVRELARRAQNDRAALERLKAVDEVDGVRVGLRSALNDVEGEELRRRLAVIEKDAGVPSAGGRSTTPIQAPRDTARQILVTPRFKPDEPPRPLAGVIRKLGEWLDPVLEPIGRFLAPVGRFIERVFNYIGDSPWRVAAFAGLLIGLVALFSGRIVQRRNRLAAEAHTRTSKAETVSSDPRELERQADAAEKAGDFDRAFRLRFLAGVLRLDKAGVIEYRPSITTGQLVRKVKSATLRPLARTFDEVAYGGRKPAAADVENAKAAWPKVLEEARR